MDRPTIRTKAMIEELLERFSVGETITRVCLDSHMPTIRALQKWRIKDKELDDACFSAEKRGILVHAAEAVDAQRSVIDGSFTGDHRRAQAIVTAANNMGHQALAKLSKLDTRYKDKQEIHHRGPMVIGWETEVAGHVETDARAISDGELAAMTDDSACN
jgi:hypothetical protein